MLVLSLLKHNCTETITSDSENWMTATFKSIGSPEFFQFCCFVRATGNFHYKSGFVPLPQSCHPNKKLQVGGCPLQIKGSVLGLSVLLILQEASCLYSLDGDHPFLL